MSRGFYVFSQERKRNYFLLFAVFLLFGAAFLFFGAAFLLRTAFLFFGAAFLVVFLLFI